MSTTIDNRVVEMQFDNSNFERNVRTSMSTVEKLKQCLNLTGAAKGLENIDTASRKMNFSGLGSAVDTIHSKFSALEVMGITALANITNSAVNAGKRIVSALTIDPIKTGFAEYETQINAVQTILANTSSKGTTMDDVNTALDTLNAYADKTIYNFTEMTRNIGTFTAAGVDLDTSVSAIQGIANLAAVSGSTSQQASTAMYQLSQALANGKVNLMDWNSVVNAGMGGEVFQNALKRTAKVMGTDVDALIEKYGSFRESLTKGEWLTTDVLTKTLEQFTMAAKEGSVEWENYKKSLMEEGYTEAQATEILKMANTATDAATKVKTFTQLWDTLKEAAQSGWTQTWEIIVGDFEEAKALLTNVSDVIGNMINNSSKVRNELLQGWKDAGGRTDLIEGVANVFEGLLNIVKPIKEAFRDIFPPMTVDQLVKFTKGFKDLTKSFENFTDKHGDQIYSTFKGIFSVLDIGWTVVKQLAGGIVDIIGHFTGLGGGILGITGGIGDWLTNLRDSIKETDIFGEAIEKITTFIGNAIDSIKEFGSSIKDSFKIDGLDGYVGFFEGVWNIIKTIGSGIAKILAPIGKSIAMLFNNANLFDVLNTGMLAGAFVGIQKFAGGFKEIFESVLGEDGLLDGIKGTLDDIRGCFEAYQNSLNAETLKKIAVAIAILAGSIFILSSIDAEALDRSVAAMALLFGELLGSFALFTKIDTKGIKGTLTKTLPLMIGMSMGILILSSALKKIADIPSEDLFKGLLGVGALMVELSLFLRTFKFDGKLAGTAVGIVILSSAMLILAKAVEDFGGMDWSVIGKGLVTIGALLAELAIFTKLTGNANHILSTGASMILLGAAMKILASVIRDFGGMNMADIGKGLLAMGGALAELTLVMRLMPKNTIGMGVGLIAVATAMKILASSLSDFGGMSWETIGAGLVAMGGALAEIAIALRLMNGTMTGSAALIIAAGALAILAPVMKSLGGMSWESIGKGLVALAGAFAVVGIAGLLLAPLVPTLLGLAGAFALFGIATLGIGIGLTAIAAGFTALATAGAAGATAFVAALTVIVVGILDLIPTIASKIGEAILTICQVIGECAPQIAETILVVLYEVLNSLATYTPQIVDSLFTFIIGLLDGLAARLPELIQSAVNVIGAFFKGVVDALSGIDTMSLFKGIAGVALLTGLMWALSSIVGLIPGAMAGVIGMGLVIAELALVLAAIGALAQIPGLSWLIEEGGNFLQTIGTAIGQFVGGIVGGIAEGATSTLPQVGSNLANFMTNAQPFFDGVKNIDASVLEGTKAIAGAILALTASNLIDSLTSWLTGGSSLAGFGADLAAFGPYMAQYAASVAGIDAAAIVASAAAAEALVKVAKAIPNDGGVVSWFTGDNELGEFAAQLVPFGKGLKSYSDAVTGLNAEPILSSVSATKALVQVAEAIPNKGGVVSWFTGDNDLGSFAKQLVPFGKGLKSYSEAVAGVNVSAISSSVMAATQLVTMINGMSNINTSGVSSFSSALSTLGKTSVDGFVKAFSDASTKLSKVGEDIFASITKGMESKQTSLKQAIDPALKSLMKCLGDKKEDFKSAGEKLMTQFIMGIKSKGVETGNALSSPVSASITKIRGYYKSFYDAGAYISSGLASGMKSKLSSVRNAADQIANEAARAARAALIIKSPSRVFYAIGEFVVQGFTKALGDGERTVYSSASNIADYARDGFNKAINKINTVFGENIDSQPAIRPILDLSDIENGASTINRMFGMTPSVGVMSNIRSISSMMNQRNQNGVNTDVVSAIDKLRKEMGNVGGTTNYSINGVNIGNDDGVAEAFETIIRAARIEGRS